jgi:hypothetical protein
MSSPSYGERGFQGYPRRLKVLNTASIATMAPIGPLALVAIVLFGVGQLLTGLEVVCAGMVPCILATVLLSRAAWRIYREGYRAFYHL